MVPIGAIGAHNPGALSVHGAQGATVPTVPTVYTGSMVPRSTDEAW